MVVNNKILLVRGGLKSKSLLSLPIRRNTSRYGSFGFGNNRFFASVSATEKLIGQNDTIQTTEQLTETVTGKVSIKVDTTTSEDTGGGLVIP